MTKELSLQDVSRWERLAPVFQTGAGPEHYNAERTLILESAVPRLIADWKRLRMALESTGKMEERGNILSLQYAKMTTAWFSHFALSKGSDVSDHTKVCGVTIKNISELSILCLSWSKTGPGRVFSSQVKMKYGWTLKVENVTKSD